jgi:hypothetical protein
MDLKTRRCGGAIAAVLYFAIRVPLKQGTHGLVQSDHCSGLAQCRCPCALVQLTSMQHTIETSDQHRKVKLIAVERKTKKI